MTFNPSSNFEFQQGSACNRRCGWRQAHQIIDRNRRWPEKLNDPVAVVGARFGIFLQHVLRRLPYFGDLYAAPEDRLNSGEYVRGLGHRDCSLLEQSVCSFTTWIKGRAGHRKDLAALFSG